MTARHRRTSADATQPTMHPGVKAFGRGLIWLGGGVLIGYGLDLPATIPRMVATGTVLVGLIVLMAVVHFVHELVATIDGIRYERGQRRLVVAAKNADGPQAAAHDRR